MPVSEGRTDYVGAFVVTAGTGAESLKERFEQEGDTYNSMLLQTLTDRLAEATAEYLHEKVRKEYWGYAPDESLSISDLYKVKYQGIRPAIGYPSLPDQLLNYTLDKLLNMSQIGVRLTENGAMYPTATVSGIYIAHPDSQYFMIGNIDEEQMKDYACRRNLSEAEVKKLLNKTFQIEIYTLDSLVSPSGRYLVRHAFAGYGRGVCPECISLYIGCFVLFFFSIFFFDR